MNLDEFKSCIWPKPLFKQECIYISIYRPYMIWLRHPGKITSFKLWSTLYKLKGNLKVLFKVSTLVCWRSIFANQDSHLYFCWFSEGLFVCLFQQFYIAVVLTSTLFIFKIFFGLAHYGEYFLQQITRVVLIFKTSKLWFFHLKYHTLCESSLSLKFDKYSVDYAYKN